MARTTHLRFKITNCTTSFRASASKKSVDFSFVAKPTSHAITLRSKETISINEQTVCEGKQIVVAFVEAEQDGKVNGYFSEVEDWGLEIALFCSPHLFTDFKNFAAQGSLPNELELTVNDATTVMSGFIVDRDEYEIVSWSFNIDFEVN